ncbi:MAG: hypothetical protein IKM97_05210 [Clostridia bacterium]|nr:hypothetical protein [Clostridia bacterium]
MTTLFSYLLTFLGIIFWCFRVIATLLYELDVEFFSVPINETLEIIVLFATLPCLLLVIKRNIIGAAAYFGIYGAYFGTALYNQINGIQTNGLTVASASDSLFLILGILISLFTFLDILLNKHRGNFGADRKTKWFYDNEKFDREFDERADRNQYKF